MYAGEINDVWSGHEEKTLAIKEIDKDGGLSSGGQVRAYLDQVARLIRRVLDMFPIQRKPSVI